MEYFLTANIKKNQYQFYGSPNPKVVQWIDRLSARLADDSTDDTTRDDLAQICKTVIRKSKEWKNTPAPAHSWQPKAAAPFSDDVVGRVITLSVKLDCETMFLDAFDLYSKEVATTTFHSVGVALLRFGLEPLLPK